MTDAQLTVRLGTDHWKGAVSRDHPTATIQVHAAVRREGRGVELVEVAAPDVTAVTAAIEAHEAVSDTAVVQHTDGEATLQVETDSPAIIMAAGEAGMPVQFPVVVETGRATVEVTGSRERLSTLGSALRDRGLSFEVEYVREAVQSSQLLTETQRELLFTAFEEGYYETPRRCSLTELAETVGLAKSTCSETLHRAEQAVVESFLEEFPAHRRPDERRVAP